MTKSVRIVGGDLGGRALRVPRGLEVRPMRSRIRESLFNAIGDRIHGKLVLDVFAGTGAIGIEAMSRGAWRAEFIEFDRKVAELLGRNLQDLGLAARTRIHSLDAYRTLPVRGNDEPFSLIFLDPPFPDYRGHGAVDPWQLARKLVESPLLAPGGLIGLEYPKWVAPPTPPPGTAVWFARAYGDTSIHIWSKDDDSRPDVQ